MDAAPPRKKCRTPPCESANSVVEEQSRTEPVIKAEALELSSITPVFPVAEDVVMKPSVQSVGVKEYIDPVVGRM